MKGLVFTKPFFYVFEDLRLTYFKILRLIITNVTLSGVEVFFVLK